MRNPSSELSPIQLRYLNLSSPYHDDHPSPTSSHKTPRISTSRHAFADFWKRLGYDRVQKDEDGETGHTEDEDDDDVEDEGEGYTRKPRFKHVRWSDKIRRKRDRNQWTLPLILVLILSVLLNLALIFKGHSTTTTTATTKPSSKPSPTHHHNTKDHPVPHDAFSMYEHGQNYTCYHTHEHVFIRHRAYESLEKKYDHLWDGSELIGKSKGYIHTSLNRPDGRVERARLAMFHQLSCLARIRRVVQSSYPYHRASHDVFAGEEGRNGKREDAVWMAGMDEPEWTYCFDYLRQVLQCQADDTIEIIHELEGAWRTWGFGSKRQCRDAGWLYDVTECGEGGCKGGPFL
ncbi:hypothetical protein CC80DRAFT_549396 [Byssothecium circinans]|uniref:Uncharacterized protein n=1 Tax=Byssothecium circinans TaxID=147558 RepID=A0A6A5TS01_9PLEO|nr:hypothetical protein CC80DRAFT_549396 [Byssothecium circinans]